MKTGLCCAVIFACVAIAVTRKPSELYGHVYYKDKTPAAEVVMTIGNYSVTSEKDGYYRLTFLKPGPQVVSVKPPGKASRSFNVTIGTQPTLRDFVIDW